MAATEVKLPVRHYTQMDNDETHHRERERQCNLTVGAMYVDYLRQGLAAVSAAYNRMNEPESWLGFHLIREGDTTDHDAMTRTLSKQCGIESYFTRDLNIAQVKSILDARYPIPAGLKYKGGGHIVLLVGYGEKGVFVHDPFGERDGATDHYSKKGGHHGEYDLYSWSTFNQLFFDNGGGADDRSGWGRVPTAIAGQPVEIPGLKGAEKKPGK